MTFINIFQNLNMNYFNGSFNCFTPNWLIPNMFMPNFSLFTQFNMPSFNWNTTSLFNFNNFPQFNFNSFNFVPSQISSSNNYNFNPAATIQNKSFNKTASGGINSSYARLSKSMAYQKALKDPSLENLSSGGRRWSISEASFRTDIPFARKGTKDILDKVTSIIGEDLVITSALGTGEAGNPHVKSGYASHHNAENPKLDISTRGKNAGRLAAKLRETGYFSRVSIESDHLDVQIDPAKFKKLDTVA